MIHCGSFVKCNNAGGCQGCEYEYVAQNREEQDYVCAHCGEDKRENILKHITEISKFLQQKIIECQKIIKDLQDSTEILRRF